jgi:hypothetical protein
MHFYIFSRARRGDELSQRAALVNMELLGSSQGEGGTRGEEPPGAGLSALQSVKV